MLFVKQQVRIPSMVARYMLSFNDKANNRTIIKAIIELVNYLIRGRLRLLQTKPITIDVNGKTVTTNIHIKPNATVKEIVAKWGEKTTTPES